MEACKGSIAYCPCSSGQKQKVLNHHKIIVIIKRFSTLSLLRGVKGHGDALLTRFAQNFVLELSAHSHCTPIHLTRSKHKYAHAHDNVVQSGKLAPPLFLHAQRRKEGLARLISSCRMHVKVTWFSRAFGANYKDEQAAKLKLFQRKESGPKPDT